jgi:hypothetical protein
MALNVMYGMKAAYIVTGEIDFDPSLITFLSLQVGNALTLSVILILGIERCVGKLQHDRNSR